MKHYQTLKQNRRNQQGQALAELVICLVAILAVFSGFLLISTLGVENVNVSIMARQKSDARARSGLLLTSSGKSIKTWSAGKDKVHFTKDDSSSAVTDTSAYVFTEQLQDNTGTLILTSNQTLQEIPDNNNFALTLDGNRLFLTAAGLGHNTETENDPLGKQHLKALKGVIRSLITKKNFVLEDTVFMPTHSPILDNQYQQTSQ